jgi:hypothetical protein
VDIYMRATPDPFSYSEGEWQADLIVGAFRDRAKAQGVATLIGYETHINSHDGVKRGGAHVMSARFVHRASHASLETLANDIRRIFNGISDTAGLERLRVSFIKPTELAPIIEVKAQRPALLLPAETALSALKLEGWLLAVSTSDGQLFAVRAYARRTGSSAGWGP